VVDVGRKLEEKNGIDPVAVVGGSQESHSKGSVAIRVFDFNFCTFLQAKGKKKKGQREVNEEFFFFFFFFFFLCFVGENKFYR
jgi:hypothetical protein